MDVGVGLAILGGSVLSKELLLRVLGPTADYVGDGLKTWTENRLLNVRRIMDIAARKLGARLEEEGAIPPRVLAGLFNEGSFIEDDVAAEYFGGVVASSRTPTGKDDRAVTWLSLISGLSATALRAHYGLHTAARTLFLGSEVGSSTALKELAMYVEEVEILDVMGVNPEVESRNAIVAHTHGSLNRLNLVGHLEWSHNDEIARRNSWIAVDKLAGDTRAIDFAPSLTGAELFLWAHGLGERLWPGAMFNPEVAIEPIRGIPHISRARKLSDFGPDQSEVVHS